MLEAFGVRDPGGILIRSPEEALRSLCVRHDYVASDAAQVNWIRFTRA